MVDVSAISVVDVCCRLRAISEREYSASNNHRIPALLALTHTMEIKDVKEKFGRFRILVIGRANAGKTTILKRICNSTENPEIFDNQGNKVRSYFMLLILQSTDGL